MKFYNYIRENVLVPRNLEGRKDKLKQNIIKLLSQEVIEGNLMIDETFEGIDDELVKVKEIKGNVNLTIKKGYIPSWLKDVNIFGSFYCATNDLTTLENCPQHVSEDFNCANNHLTSLKGCSKFVGENFYCQHNLLTTLKNCPKYIGGNFYCGFNKEVLHLPEGIEVYGKFVN